MGLRIARVTAELSAFYGEVVVDNGPRYKDPREWPHLYVDLFVSFFAMSYTLGHLAAIGLPLYALWRIYGG
jgi:hypothetical protein